MLASVEYLDELISEITDVDLENQDISLANQSCATLILTTAGRLLIFGLCPAEELIKKLESVKLDALLKVGLENMIKTLREHWIPDAKELDLLLNTCIDDVEFSLEVMDIIEACTDLWGVCELLKLLPGDTQLVNNFLDHVDEYFDSLQTPENLRLLKRFHETEFLDNLRFLVSPTYRTVSPWFLSGVLEE